MANGNFTDEFGFFSSPAGESFGSRALPADYQNTKPYRKYKIIKEIPNVKQGRAAPWFNQPGLGIQYQLPLSIDDLLNAGYIILIN